MQFVILLLTASDGIMSDVLCSQIVVQSYPLIPPFSQQEKAIQNATLPSSDTCDTILDPANATSVLERILQELEVIKQTKELDLPPDGIPCDIAGKWNSEIIGMSFDIHLTNTTTEFQPLNITINNHNPPKRVTLMDTNWTCNGNTLREKGGPFYITTFKRRDEIMATFTGI